MGYNTVAMVLNDHSHLLLESPKTFAWALAHPPMGNDLDQWRRQVQLTAQANNERPINVMGGVIVLPTFHADTKKFLIAGNNMIEELPVRAFRTSRSNEKTVTLALPAWWK